ncbi:DUF4179 domain-containing protein [Heyndrickxia sp. NPDC080065]|uniref:DUF4179 domain-containing protein n=1 Tax=Heyndrickxia sp. NPDC080065 TaxID=3390568 RepID=UPI003D073596
MFEKEEERLQGVKKDFDDISIPENRLDQAIFTGIQKAHRQKKHSSFWIKTLIAAAAIVILFLGSIRVSDTFASYIVKIPGMESIVELIRDDKGLLAAVGNEYVQKINQSDEHEGMKIVLDSIIVDEEQMVMFYYFETNKKPSKPISSKSIHLEKENGEELNEISYSCCHEDAVVKKGRTKLVENTVDFANSISDEKLTLVMKLAGFSSEWRIPFSIDRSKISKKKTIQMQKTVTVEDQQIFIDHVTFSPTKVGINVKFPAQNSKEIFDIEDLRLVDEHGEEWSKIQNGLVARWGDNEKTYYLQSNYFEKPKKLYLVFNKIRALDRDEVNVVVDPAKETIIKAPKDGKLYKVKSGALYGNNLGFYLSEEIYYQMFENSYTDSAGKLHEISSYMWSGSTKSGTTIGFPYSINDSVSRKPITLKLTDYPAYIHGDVKIRIK